MGHAHRSRKAARCGHLRAPRRVEHPRMRDAQRACSFHIQHPRTACCMRTGIVSRASSTGCFDVGVAMGCSSRLHISGSPFLIDDAVERPARRNTGIAACGTTGGPSDRQLREFGRNRRNVDRRQRRGLRGDVDIFEIPAGSGRTRRQAPATRLRGRARLVLLRPAVVTEPPNDQPSSVTGGLVPSGPAGAARSILFGEISCCRIKVGIPDLDARGSPVTVMANTPRESGNARATAHTASPGSCPAAGRTPECRPRPD